ncbi:hypothetical protein DL766_002639 [Monosporascus sp. MC13-8B]|uniref:Uncharacterized protein n=1 Tax=Monosporascus cannonballus TaxID=155416 RepID=A0ABY0HCY9_9PEZI|nr:hypothetical protein DL762_003051 [Monosporascus cannonballus]RYO90298.1 hypothetical protein DL763_005382 [Monosporascus cannonballus]RYP35192.1 hypothetical protein DL766_002639 [Monosporascus sp. MC13-8B]
MTDPAGSDKFLLERLNALKPTTITLDPSPEHVPASTIEPAKPLSKEDALSERLKSLRSQIETGPAPSPGSVVHRSGSDTNPSAPPPRTGAKSTQPRANGAGDSPTGPRVSRRPTQAGPGDVDPLLHTDDQTLEELLADLGSDQAWLDEVAAEEEEHRRVNALLEELGKTSTNDRDRKVSPSREARRDSHGEDSDDDSEGDEMTRAADEVLAKALDDIELEANQPTPQTTASAISSHGEQITDTNSSSEPANQPAAEPQEGGREPGSIDPLKLPGVPLELQDPPDLPSDADSDADFEASIASRMAALKVSSSSSSPGGPVLPSAPASDLNSLGLPGAPTFAPHDRPVPGVARRLGFTDEDQRSWCVVCLEDGGVRCLGCDGDVYCARCWREMHVGPRAGYDERGHRWEKYVRAR